MEESGGKFGELFGKLLTSPRDTCRKSELERMLDWYLGNKTQLGMIMD